MKKHQHYASLMSLDFKQHLEKWSSLIDPKEFIILWGDWAYEAHTTTAARSQQHGSLFK